MSHLEDRHPLRKIRALHLIHQLGAGGAENGIINLANGISRDHFRIAVCAFASADSQSDRLMRNRAALFALNKREGNDLRVPLKLYRLFKSWKPDIVHTHAWGTLCEGIAAAKAARVPVVIHGEHGTIQNKISNIVVQKILWRLPDRILSVSREHARKLSMSIGFPLNKISVLINGVDCHRFGLSNARQSLRDDMGFSRDDIVVGTVGRLVPVKNQALLLNAFARLAERHHHANLVIAGDGPLRGELEELSFKLGCSPRIKFLGRRSDIPDIMAAMDIFVLTSHSEGMSNTILEAMSSELPVVATNVGGNPELVVDRETGLLFPSNDVAALLLALEPLVERADMRKAMGLKGRARAVRHFSLQAMIQNYERLYHQCYLEKTGRYSSRGWCNTQ